MIDVIATTTSNRELALGYWLLTLQLTEDIQVRPGQFAMLKPHASLEPLLRRALAVYRVHSPREVSFLYQVIGRGTELLSQVTENGQVDALLPLGNSWPVRGQDKYAIVVAGGIGSASVFMLCEQLLKAGIRTQILFGAANKRTAIGCGLEDFRELGLPLIVTTDDGSLGEHALVTAPLERLLSEDGGAAATIYACGPWAMMSRVADLAARFDLSCYVSLEAPMGCGFGVCVGCVVAVKSNEQFGYGSYRRVCTDGSIFPAEAIRWEVEAMTH